MPVLSHFCGRGKSCAKLISAENWREISHLKKFQIWPICGNFEVSDQQFSDREIIIAIRHWFYCNKNAMIIILRK